MTREVCVESLLSSVVSMTAVDNDECSIFVSVE